MQKPLEVSIDTKNQSSMCSYDNVRKGDTLLMDISIYQNSANLDLAGQSMHIVLKKSDNYCVEKIIKSVTGNNFKIAFDVQATLAVGDVEGIIEISDNNGTDITNVFTFEVKENPACDIVLQSKNEIETLSQIVALINSYNANADNLAKQNDLALQHETTLTSLNTTSGTLANRLETDITTGTEVAVRLETDITTGNQLDSNLKQDISEGNTLHNNLLIDILNGNATISQLKDLNWPYIQSMFYLIEKMIVDAIFTDENSNRFTDENGNYLTM